MTKLPKTIIVVAIKHSNKYSHLRKICKEFFEGFPCIEITLDDGKDYYILPSSEIINSTLDSIYDALDTIVNIAGFHYETYVYDTVNPRIWDTYTIDINTLYDDELPEYVTIFDPNDIEVLKVFSED